MPFAKKVQRVAAYALAREADRLLLVQIGSGEWMLPGGGVEHGEHPEQALVREMREETGLDVTPGALLHVGSDHRMIRRNTDFHCVYFVYAVTVVGGTLRAEPDGTTTAPTWTPVAALPQLTLLAGHDEVLPSLL